MRLELFKDGELYMTIEATGQDVDFTILPKSIVKDSSLSPKSFEDLFFRCTRECSTYVEGYEKAEQVHEQYFGVRKYSSYNSFQTAKSKLKR